MRLPIDAHLEAIVSALTRGGVAVVEAPPGAGKTTRIPPALLAAGLADDGEILVVQPRRIAARMAARRVAQELGEAPGERCGYQVRFETVAGPGTRIRFVTDGILMRRFRDDPDLRGVAAVVLDEFHERRIAMDTGLALAQRLRQTSRPDLGVLVMSATLDGQRVADFLDAPRIRTEGRTFPVEIQYRPPKRDAPLSRQVSDALRETFARDLEGHVLVFLPGAREIRAVEEACAGLARGAGLDLVTLHGDLPPAQQDRAIAGENRRVILSTNVAETSVTIDGVTTVIDSGLARIAGHDPWSGVPTLSVERISQASAIQRAGRAGRTRPGTCMRLYSEPDFNRRREHDAPEISRSDLAEVCLDLALVGVREPSAFPWFEAPPGPALEASLTLLHRLGAVDEGGITPTGRAMAKLPAHPRLARLMLEAKTRGVAATATTVAALLGERPLRRRRGPPQGPTHRANADVLVEADLVETPGGEDLDRGVLKRVRQVRQQLGRALGPEARLDRSDDVDEAMGLALLAAFPDRLGRVRKDRDGDRVVHLPGIGAVELARQSAVLDASLVVAVALEERREGTSRRPLVRSASLVEPEWLLELFPDDLEEEIAVHFDSDKQRVESRQQTRLWGVVIEEQRLDHVPPQAAAALRDAALRVGAAVFIKDPEALGTLQGRVAFARSQGYEMPPLDGETIATVLGDLCEGKRSFAELRKADLLSHVRASLGEHMAALDRMAPSHVSTAGGRRLPVHYPLDGPPWVSSRLQDFFGSTEGPTVANGRVPVVLHLLAPNQRAVQVSTDLAGFWTHHYPGLRKTLMRRYPKHDWPEDPRSAKPPAPRPRGARRRR